MHAPLAFSSLLFPKYWPAITAPPVASAENPKINSCIRKSTNETPEIAAAPKDATITESANPTKNSSPCSISNGKNRTNNALLENK